MVWISQGQCHENERKPNHLVVGTFPNSLFLPCFGHKGLRLGIFTGVIKNYKLNQLLYTSWMYLEFSEI